MYEPYIPHRLMIKDVIEVEVDPEVLPDVSTINT